MALTKEEYTAKLKRISELSGDNEEIMTELADIQTELDSRENPGSAYTDADVFDKDGTRWSDKYNDMTVRYRERFFGGSADTIKQEQTKDIEKDDIATTITFDDLFSAREGD